MADFLDVGVLASMWVLGSSWNLEFPLVTGVKEICSGNLDLTLPSVYRWDRSSQWLPSAYQSPRHMHRVLPSTRCL